jgi:hypothetical protein
VGPAASGGRRQGATWAVNAPLRRNRPAALTAAAGHPLSGWLSDLAPRPGDHRDTDRAGRDLASGLAARLQAPIPALTGRTRKRGVGRCPGGRGGASGARTATDRASLDIQRNRSEQPLLSGALVSQMGALTHEDTSAPGGDIRPLPCQIQWIISQVEFRGIEDNEIR